MRDFINGALAVACIAAFSGCAGLPGHDANRAPGRLLHPEKEEMVVKETVDVGGRVANPTSLTIPESGLTLLQAVTRAGGVLESDTLFMLKRQGPLARQNYYFPASLVRQQVAGSLALRGGDMVQVVPVSETQLGAEAPGAPNPTFQVTGLVSRPGAFDLGGQTFADLTTPDLAGAAPSASIVVVTRPFASGLTVEHFVLPATILLNEFADFAIFPNDNIVFTTLDRVPAVQAGLLETLQRQRAVRQKQRRCLLAAAAAEQPQRSSIPGFGVVKQAGSSLVRLVTPR